MLTEEESGRSWFNANNNMKIHKLVIVEKCKTVSCLLSHIEKTNLYKLIGCKEKFSPNNDKSKNYFGKMYYLLSHYYKLLSALLETYLFNYRLNPKKLGEMLF